MKLGFILFLDSYGGMLDLRNVKDTFITFLTSFSLPNIIRAFNTGITMGIKTKHF